MQVSLSSTANCYANAPMESYFSTLKVEQVHAQDYQTRQEAGTDISEYIEVFYNPMPRHSSLGYLSPEEFERQYMQACLNSLSIFWREAQGESVNLTTDHTITKPCPSPSNPSCSPSNTTGQTAAACSGSPTTPKSAQAP
jgi:putative transposase